MNGGGCGIFLERCPEVFHVEIFILKKGNNV